MRAAACLALALVASSATAASVLESLTAEMPWQDAQGYSPVVVTVEARADGELSLTANLGNQRATTRVALQAGVPRRLTLLLPPLDDRFYGTGMLSWRFADGERDQVAISHNRGSRGLDLVVVDSDESISLRKVADHLQKTSLSVDSRHSGRSSWDESRMVRLPTGHLPDRWQGYPGWLTVLLARPDDARLAPEQRQAIATWVRAGGQLLVQDRAQVEAWRSLGIEPRTWSIERKEDLDLLAETLRGNLADHAFAPVPGVIPGTESVPVGGFMLLAIGFAAVVGPLNLWWVHRRRARHLFLITTPLLSLVTCVGLIAYNLVAEGVSLRRVSVQHTILDQQAQQAVSWCRQTYFGGFSVSSFALDAEAKAQPFEARDFDEYSGRRGGSEHRLAIDWSGGGQQVSGDWIPARINRQLLFSQARPERFRLQIVRDAGGWVLTNGLGVGIERLLWRDRDGGTWELGEPLAANLAAPLRQLTRQRADFDAEVGIDHLGLAAARRWKALIGQPLAFQATLQAPFGALPGPAADDARPPQAHVCGLLVPDGPAAVPAPGATGAAP